MIYIKEILITLFRNLVIFLMAFLTGVFYIALSLSPILLMIKFLPVPRSGISTVISVVISVGLFVAIPWTIEDFVNKQLKGRSMGEIK